MSDVISRIVKTKYFIILEVMAVLVIASTIFIVSTKNRRQQQMVKTLEILRVYRDQLDGAVQTYVHSQKPGNNVAPTAVSLRELVSRGYLHSNDFPGLLDRDVSISLNADDRYPQAIWVRVHTANGRDIVEMRDGQIRTIPSNTGLESATNAP